VEHGRDLVNGQRRVQPKDVVRSAADEVDAAFGGRDEQVRRGAVVDQADDLGPAGEQLARHRRAEKAATIRDQNPPPAPRKRAFGHGLLRPPRAQ
jgi:hypothetical protein